MKNNIPLIIGIALPIVLIGIVSLFIFIPKASVNPSHNFIYTLENESGYRYDQLYKNTYSLKGEKIALEQLPALPPEYKDYSYKGETPTLYLYNVEAETSTEITFEEAQKLSLVPGPSSPDGYTVSYDYGHNGVFELFGSNNENTGYFISKGTAKKKLTAFAVSEYYGMGSFRLIGWIK